MLDQRPRYRFTPADPDAVRARFQKIASRASERATDDLAAIKPGSKPPAAAPPRVSAPGTSATRKARSA